MSAAKRQRFKYDVFISYSHRNKEWVRDWLLPQLKSTGLKVCIDHESFAPGAPLLTEMERAVLQSRKTIAILTPAYIAGGSGWTEFENILLQTLDPAAQRRRLIPLLLEQCELPIRLSYLISIDFIRSAGHDEGLDRLVSIIRQRLAASRKRVATATIALSFEAPTGTLAPSSPVYIERQYDQMLQQQVEREGSTTHIEGARQMGKSSLLQQVLAHASTRQYAVIDVDFQTFDEQHLDRLDTLLRYLADTIHARLKLAASPDETWQGPLGAKDKLTSYMNDYALQGALLPTVMVMDEVDRVFGRDYQNDFFGLLRSWHNQRASNPLWRKLNLVLAYANDPREAIKDLHQSPFNVGTTIRLGDFTLAEVGELNRRYQRPLKNTAQLQQLIDAIGGHPYLVQQALYALATRTHTLPELLNTHNAETGPFADHLQAHVHRLAAAPELQQAMQQVLRNGHCPTRTLFTRLRSLGLVTGRNHRAVAPRCGLYAAYLREVLV